VNWICRNTFENYLAVGQILFQSGQGLRCAASVFAVSRVEEPSVSLMA